MNRTIIEKLCAFGLSPNEAKVYLSIINDGCTLVKDVSAATNIHSQDVYKIINKLEKKGLILKRFCRPLKIEIIPVEQALNQIILSLKHENEQKINRLETFCAQIKDTIQKRV